MCRAATTLGYHAPSCPSRLCCPCNFPGHPPATCKLFRNALLSTLPVELEAALLLLLLSVSLSVCVLLSASSSFSLSVCLLLSRSSSLSLVSPSLCRLFVAAAAAQSFGLLHFMKSAARHLPPTATPNTPPATTCQPILSLPCSLASTSVYVCLGGDS